MPAQILKMLLSDYLTPFDVSAITYWMKVCDEQELNYFLKINQII